MTIYCNHDQHKCVYVFMNRWLPQSGGRSVVVICALTVMWWFAYDIAERDNPSSLCLTIKLLSLRAIQLVLSRSRVCHKGEGIPSPMECLLRRRDSIQMAVALWSPNHLISLNSNATNKRNSCDSSPPHSFYPTIVRVTKLHTQKACLACNLWSIN